MYIYDKTPTDRQNDGDLDKDVTDGTSLGTETRVLNGHSREVPWVPTS